MIGSVLVLLLLQAPATPDPGNAAPSRSPWSTATDLELVADERDSLAGVSRLALTVNVPEALTDSLAADALRSTVAFQLEQAGLIVATTRAVEDPLLAITVRTIDGSAESGRPARMLYRVYADLLQLVRLADLDGKARLMMASTWHAGSFGALDSDDASLLRPRVAEVVDTFLADHRAVNDRPAPPSRLLLP